VLGTNSRCRLTHDSCGFRDAADGNEQARRKRLGRLLREARQAVDLTQAAVARTLGYRQQINISHIEHGARLLELIEVENFAHLYGRALSDFATWRDDQPTTEELRQRAARNQEEALKFQRAYYKPR